MGTVCHQEFFENWLFPFVHCWLCFRYMAQNVKEIGQCAAEMWQFLIQLISASLLFKILNFYYKPPFCIRIPKHWSATIMNFWQESRAAARKPRDAASVLFRWSSPTTFTTSIRLAKFRKRQRFRAPNMLMQTQFNTKSGFKVNQSHVFGVGGKTVRQ